MRPVFTIRRAQFRAMSKQLRQRFTDDMVRHLHENFLGDCKKQGIAEQNLRLLVSSGIETAAKFDIVDRQDVQLYLECLVLLGPAFEADERLPWAGKILNRTNLIGKAKMDLIHDHLVFTQMKST